MKQHLDLKNSQQHKKIRREISRLKLEVPHRYMQGVRNERGATGNYIFNCKNIRDSYYTDRCEDCAYCAQVVDLRDCADNNFTEENEGCIDYLGAYQNKFLHYSKFCNQVSESFYCDSCFSSQNLFGCVGMRNAKNCIFNKSYVQHEYEKRSQKIIAHMRETGEWGEFFPIELSPFAYNETVAQEYFPLEKYDVLSRDWKWREMEKMSSNTTSDDTRMCKCGRSFRLQRAEQKFYEKMDLPVPQKCPDCRHADRMTLRTPRKLFSRKCDQCLALIQTTFAPDRPEKIFCEKCYNAAVR